MGLALLGLLSIASCVYAYFVVDHMSDVVERIVQVELPAVSRLDRLLHLVGDLHRLERRVLSEPVSLSTRTAMDDTVRELQGVLAVLTPVPNIPSGDRMLRAFEHEVQALIVTERQILTLEDQNASFEARQLATDLIPARARLLEAGARLLALYANYIEKTELDNLLALRTLREGALGYALVCALITVLMVLAGIRTVLVPMRDLVGVARRVSAGDLSARSPPSGDDEFGELGGAINRMVDSVQTQLREVALMNEALQRADREHQRQLNLAQNVQKSIVPRQAKAVGLDLYTEIQSAQMIGGDFFDVQVLEALSDRPPRVALAVGDASGHGIPAALVMVLTLALMREASRQTCDPSEILVRVNKGMREQFPNELVETFVTACYLIVDPTTGNLRMSSAGNEPPILWRRRRGRVEVLENVGMFLGTFEDSQYHTLETTLEVGDRIVLFSDGLTESRSPGGAFFGRERLEEIVRDSAHLSVHDLGERIVAALESFSQRSSPRDDVALLIAELKGVPA